MKKRSKVPHPRTVAAIAATASALCGCGTAGSEGTPISQSENSTLPTGQASATTSSGAVSKGVSTSSASASTEGSTSNGGSTPSGTGSSSLETVSSSASAGGPSSARSSSSQASSSSGSGASGSSSASSTTTGPCDIYGAAGTPCVAAHSTVRALFGAYDGALYQVRRASDETTKDVPVLARGGFANASTQDEFCAGTTCTISIIYDQSPEGNDLPVSPVARFLPNGGKEAPADAAKISVGGHEVYGVYVAKNVGTAYRINKTKGIATGDNPEAMYMVLDGKRFSGSCCFDYGNAETDGHDDGNATMEAIYWGSDTKWSLGVGTGPWVCGDLENGMYKGDVPTGVSPPPATNTSVTGMAFVTAMLKGPSGNQFGLKAGNAQSGTLATKWDGARPPGYTPMKKQGAIILGTGGDGSDGGDGTFFEGCMTSGNPSNSTDDAVQANVVAAGYGR